MKTLKKFISCVLASAALISAVPMSANASMTLKLGDYVQMGTYYDQPVLWRCVGFEKVTGYDDAGNPIIDSTDVSTEQKDGYLPLMLSNRDLCLKSFDVGGSVADGSHGRGKDNGKNRQKSGSNYWNDSNIRSWLNSNASAGNVVWLCGNSSAYCGYSSLGASEKFANEAGFLTSFNETGIDAIKPVTQKSLLDAYEYSQSKDSGCYHFNTTISNCVQNYADATSEQVTDSVFLLDVMQANNVYNNMSALDAEYYIGKITKQCADNAEVTNAKLHADKKYATWLRTPYTESTSANVCTISTNGDISFAEAYIQNGIRPAFFFNYEIMNIGSGHGKETDPYIVTSDNQVKVTINDLNVDFDQVPRIIDGRTLVPVRAIFEAIGATVLWDDTTKTVSASKGVTKISLTIDNDTMKKGLQDVELDVPAQIINGRTFVPARAIAEAFDCEVTWDSDTKTVKINTMSKSKK